MPLAKNVEALIRQAVGDVFAAAGFKRSSLVFCRQHGEMTHITQFHVRTITGMGTSAPRGSIRWWVRLARTKGIKKPLTCVTTMRPDDVNLEIKHLVPGLESAWTVPPARGSKSKELVASLREIAEELLEIIDPVRTPADLKALARVKLRPPRG